MKLRYASIVVLLSSALGLGLFYMVPSSPNTVAVDSRLYVVVPVPPLAAVLKAFVDENNVRVESLLAAGADVHHHHQSPSQLRRLAAADVALPTLGEGDPHMWLSQQGLAAFVAEVTPKLDENSRLAGQAFLVHRHDWLSHERGRFAPFQNTPFVVDHDAFQGFENDVGLKGKLGALTSGHDQAIGAKSLKALRAKTNGKAVCVLHGPHAHTKRIATMLEGAMLHFTQADPLLWNDPSYKSGMQRLANAFYECLAAAQLAEATP